MLNAGIALLLRELYCRFYLAWMVMFATSGKLMTIFADNSKLTDEELTIRTNTLTVGTLTQLMLKMQ
jgi:hypothetical protein